MAFEGLTNLDLKVTREPGVKKNRKRVYVDKVHGLSEALQDGGYYKDDYETILLALGKDVAKLAPDLYGSYEIEEMDSDQVLAVLTAIVRRDEDYEGFAARCLKSGLIDELLERLEAIDYENREIPSWIEEATDTILLELMDFPKDKETTANRLIQPYLHYIDANGVYAERPYDLFDSEMDVVDLLHRKAKDYGLYLDSSAYAYMDIGTPGNIPFKVRRVEKGSDGPKTIFAFSLGGMFNGQCSIKIEEFVDEYVCTMCNKELLIKQRAKIENVSQEQLSRLEATIEKSGIKDWESEYSNLVLDGESWSIMINDNSGAFESLGSNKYPKGFNALIDCLHDVFGLEANPPEGGYEGLFDN